LLANEEMSGTDAPEAANYTATRSREYLLRLGRCAAKRLNQAMLNAMRDEIRSARPLPDHPNGQFDIAKALNRPIAEVRAALADRSELGCAVRTFAPLELVVPRAKREAIMRSVAGEITAHGSTMAERWPSNVAAPMFVDALVERTISALEPARANFTRFVRSTATVRWMIAADFCIGDGKKPNDVFAYTVHPIRDLDAMRYRAQVALPRDYKDTRRELHEDALRYLRSPDTFSFAFLPPRSRAVITDVAAAREGIEQTLKAVIERRDSARFTAEKAQYRALRQRANANSFDFRLLEKMMLCATFAGTVATLLAAEGRADWVVWLPDRDDMTTAYGEILAQIFAADVWAFALRRRLPPLRVMYRAEDLGQSDGKAAPWYDPLIRIPDFLAGTLAGLDYRGTGALGNPKRDARSWTR
jgi:hypothetical protein